MAVYLEEEKKTKQTNINHMIFKYGDTIEKLKLLDIETVTILDFLCMQKKNCET